MKEVDLQEVAKRNLVETYVALGVATQCAQLLQGEQIVGCIGEFPHPMCNFAVCSGSPSAAVEELHELAVAHPAFHVYVCFAKGKRSPGGPLLRAGFRIVHTLVEMMSIPPAKAEAIPLTRATLLDDRRQVARFMMSQFFSRHPDWIRDRVCESTATAHGLDLYALHAGREVVGAVMLRPSADSFGLYNLCVAGMHRGQRHGSDIVGMVQRHAALSGLPVVLQCNRELERWYRSLGFASVGSIEVYALPPTVR